MNPGLSPDEIPMSLQGKREPLVDVIEDAESVKVLADARLQLV